MLLLACFGVPRGLDSVCSDGVNVWLSLFTFRTVVTYGKINVAKSLVTLTKSKPKRTAISPSSNFTAFP